MEIVFHLKISDQQIVFSQHRRQWQPAEVDFLQLAALKTGQAGPRSRDYGVKPPEDTPELSAD